MLKVYLAARYSRRDEMREHRKVLQAIGLQVTSRWLDEKSDTNGDMGEETDEFYIETAIKDLADIERADAFILFSENPLEGFKRGGRHFESGYAFKAKKVIYVVGECKENVFHYLPGIVHFATFEDLTTDLKRYAKETNGTEEKRQWPEV